MSNSNTKINIPIPMNPIGENFVWRDWFQKLSNRIYGSIASQDAVNVQIGGGTIDNTVIGGLTPAAGTFSSLTTAGLTGYLYGHDSSGPVTASTTIPATAITGLGSAINHNDLSAIQGGSSTERYHLTAAQQAQEVANDHDSMNRLQGGTTGQYYHLTLPVYTQVTTPPHIETYDLTSSITVGTTPFVLKPATTVAGNQGITYDNTTGIFTFTNAGTYTLSINVNCYASSANQIIYIWAELNTGSGWVANPQGGKIVQLVNNQEFQAVNAQAVYRIAGSQVRYWIYGNDSHTSLITSTLPSISSTVYVPAIRFQFIG